jgi:Cu/Ag efflux protein CusF
MSEDPELMDVYGRHASLEASTDPGTTVELVTDQLDGGPYFEAADADLANDPFADDLDNELAARATRRLANRATTVLFGLLLLVGGFLAGAQAQKHWGAVPASSNSNAGNAGNFGNLAGGGFGGRNGNNGTGASSPASNSMTGTVKLVDGTTVYIQLTNGDVVTVKTSGSTSVQVAQTGSLSQLTPGTRVTVEGQSGGQNIVNATKVTATR